MKKLILALLISITVFGVSCNQTEDKKTDASTTPESQTTQAKEQDKNEENSSPKEELTPDVNQPTQNKTEDNKDTIEPYEMTTSLMDVSYEAEKFETKVKAYSVSEDLGEIVNLEQFGDFSGKQKELLHKNLFFVSKTKQEQLFYIYENNEYLKIPSFITTDSVLQVYHQFFGYSLRTIEKEKLYPILIDMTKSMYEVSYGHYEEAKNPLVKDASLKNTAFFAVALNLLDINPDYKNNKELEELTNAELALVNNMGGFEVSEIFKTKLDYSQYKPRGHYTRSEELKKYFKAMMWYGQVTFEICDKESSVLDEEDRLCHVTQSLLITKGMTIDADRTTTYNWQRIYDITKFYVGESDDINIYQIEGILKDVFGEKVDIDDLGDVGKIEEVIKLVNELPKPKIQTRFNDASKNAGVGLRFMGQRYIPDSEMLQNLSWNERPMPKGLDVLGVLGSNRAYDHVLNTLDTSNIEIYKNEHEKLKKSFSSLPEKKWQSNMYHGWLWSLKGFLNEYSDGYPSFMTNGAWTDKSLNTALASWSELRHDTILYGKSSGAECGDGFEQIIIKGYVEPNVEVYEKLRWLTEYSRVNLVKNELITERLKGRMMDFEEMLTVLKNISVKELANEKLTEEEYYQIRMFGGTLERLTIATVEGTHRWYEITNEAEKNMAMVADVHTTSGSYLHEAVGYANEIYVIVPIEGELHLTRGAVFSHYEFTDIERLNDEQWREKLKNGQEPPLADWTESFMADEKEEVPGPLIPYTSGC